jgi:hypothetical protein
MPKNQWIEFDQRYLHIALVLDIVLNARPVFPSALQATQFVGPESLLDEQDQLSPACLVYATLQHYGVPSPFVDLTSNLKTALFFCSYPPDPKSDVAVMFVVDSEHEEIRKRLAPMPDSERYLNSRHSRQNAHGLCLRLGSGIRDVDYVPGENFRLLGGVREQVIFTWPADLRGAFHKQHEKALLSVPGDRLAAHVYEASVHGLDEQAFDSIRVDEVFRRVRHALEDRM